MCDKRTYGNTDLREGRPTSDKWKNLVDDVAAAGGPCTKVEVWKRPDGAWEVLSGWHNVKACIQAKIIRVPAENITVVTPKDEAEALRVLFRRNIRGKVDTLKVAKLIGDLCRHQGRSQADVAQMLLWDKKKKPYIQKMLGLYDLMELVDPKYQYLTKKVPQKGREGILKLVKKTADHDLATALVRGLAHPALFVRDLRALNVPIDEATIKLPSDNYTSRLTTITLPDRQRGDVGGVASEKSRSGRGRFSGASHGCSGEKAHGRIGPPWSDRSCIDACRRRSQDGPQVPSPWESAIGGPDGA